MRIINKSKRTQPKKSFILPVVVEPDGDKWNAHIPGLVDKGAATWGKTKEEALNNIHDVAHMVVESLIEHGETLPTHVTESDQPVIAVTV